MKIAFITGITGQDGLHLIKFLQNKKYIIHGLIRPKSLYDWGIIKSFPPRYLEGIKLHQGDIRNSRKIAKIIETIQPDEIYNLAAQTNVELAEQQPLQTYEINALGLLNLLEAIRLYKPTCRLFQAGTIMQFNLNKGIVNESSEFCPDSVYGASKHLAYEHLRYYRKHYNLFLSTGFLSNHESIYRKKWALSKYIVANAVRYSQGQIENFSLYNIDQKKYWGHARDHVQAMWGILQQDTADDFIISPNEVISTKDFCSLVFSSLGINLFWRKEKGLYLAYHNIKKVIIEESGRINYYDYELENNKITNKTGWRPETSVSELVKEMIDEELKN